MQFFTAVSNETAASIFANIQPQNEGSVFLLHVFFLPFRVVETLKKMHIFAP